MSVRKITFTDLATNALDKSEKMSLHIISASGSLLLVFLTILIVTKLYLSIYKNENAEYPLIHLGAISLIIILIIAIFAIVQIKYLSLAINITQDKAILQNLQFEKRNLLESLKGVKDLIEDTSNITNDCINHVNLIPENQTSEANPTYTQESELNQNAECDTGLEDVQVSLADCQGFNDSNICNTSSCVGDVCPMESFVTNITDCGNKDFCTQAECNLRADGQTLYCPSTYAYEQTNIVIGEDTCALFDNTQICDPAQCQNGDCKMVSFIASEEECANIPECKVENCSGDGLSCPYQKFNCKNLCNPDALERQQFYEEKIKTIETRLKEIDAEIEEIQLGITQQQVIISSSLSMANIVLLMILYYVLFSRYNYKLSATDSVLFSITMVTSVFVVGINATNLTKIFI